MQRTKTDFEVVSNDKEFTCSSQHWTNESGISIFFLCLFFFRLRFVFQVHIISIAIFD